MINLNIDKNSLIILIELQIIILKFEWLPFRQEQGTIDL